MKIILIANFFSLLIMVLFNKYCATTGNLVAAQDFIEIKNYLRFLTSSFFIGVNYSLFYYLQEHDGKNIKYLYVIFVGLSCLFVPINSSFLVFCAAIIYVSIRVIGNISAWKNDYIILSISVPFINLVSILNTDSVISSEILYDRFLIYLIGIILITIAVQNINNRLLTDLKKLLQMVVKFGSRLYLLSILNTGLVLQVVKIGNDLYSDFTVPIAVQFYSLTFALITALSTYYTPKIYKGTKNAHWIQTGINLASLLMIFVSFIYINSFVVSLFFRKNTEYSYYGAISVFILLSLPLGIQPLITRLNSLRIVNPFLLGSGITFLILLILPHFVGISLFFIIGSFVFYLMTLVGVIYKNGDKL